MYHVSTQGVDERMMKVHYYEYSNYVREQIFAQLRTGFSGQNYLSESERSNTCYVIYFRFACLSGQNC